MVARASGSPSMLAASAPELITRSRGLASATRSLDLGKRLARRFRVGQDDLLQSRDALDPNVGARIQAGVKAMIEGRLVDTKHRVAHLAAIQARDAPLVARSNGFRSVRSMGNADLAEPLIEISDL